MVDKWEASSFSRFTTSNGHLHLLQCEMLILIASNCNVLRANAAGIELICMFQCRVESCFVVSERDAIFCSVDVELNFMLYNPIYFNFYLKVLRNNIFVLMVKDSFLT